MDPNKAICDLVTNALYYFLYRLYTTIVMNIPIMIDRINIDLVE